MTLILLKMVCHKIMFKFLFYKYVVIFTLDNIF
jgi:hypothetical protein